MIILTTPTSSIKFCNTAKSSIYILDHPTVVALRHPSQEEEEGGEISCKHFILNSIMKWKKNFLLLQGGVPGEDGGGGYIISQNQIYFSPQTPKFPE